MSIRELKGVVGDCEVWSRFVDVLLRNKVSLDSPNVDGIMKL